MLDAYQKLLSASAGERKDAYEAAAAELGIRGEFVEKDLWVCLTLELLFGSNKPPCAMTFKGGTSLSKAFGLIQRFSEDIDVVLAHEGLSIKHDIERLRGLSRGQQNKAFDALQGAATAYVGNVLRAHLERCLIDGAFGDAKLEVAQEDQQALLLSYASVYQSEADYIRPTVRIECGPRSAHEPATKCSITPYLARVVYVDDLAVPEVPTIKAERTFWEKVFILHGHHCHYRDDGIVPVDRNRLSRHYYDVAKLASSPAGANAIPDRNLLDNVRSHNQLAFPSAWRKYEEGVPGSFLIVPQAEVRKAIEADYAQMQSMVFGDVPKFSWILEQIQGLQDQLNVKPG